MLCKLLSTIDNKFDDFTQYSTDFAISSSAFSTGEKSKPDDLHARQTFVETYLSYPTKADQFASFKRFGDQVMNLGDAHDRGVLTGEKNVRSLEQKLAKVLKEFFYQY